MSEFILLMRGDEGSASPDEMQGRMQHYMEWMHTMMAEERFVAGQPLEARGAHLMDRDNVVTDGPFLEPKEIIGGYVILKANDIDEAIELARGCPLLAHCQIMVRPLITVPG